MACPRCGESLTTFTLRDREALVCESCEYVGIPADHHPESRGKAESWDEALERFLTDEKREAEEDTPANSVSDDAAADSSRG